MPNREKRGVLVGPPSAQTTPQLSGTSNVVTASLGLRTKIWAGNNPASRPLGNVLARSPSKLPTPTSWPSPR